MGDCCDAFRQRQRWGERAQEAAEFVIDETFGVPGVGTVVAGTLKRGIIRTNSNLLLGPDVGDGSFRATAVKSVHYKRMPVNQVGAYGFLATHCHCKMAVIGRIFTTSCRAITA